MRIIQFSDMHLWRLRVEPTDAFYFKRWLGLVNLIVNRSRKYPSSIIDQMLDHLVKQDADAVIFTGDVTTTGLKAEFSDAERRFRPLRDRWGEHFVLLPGNHDRYTTRCIENRHFERLVTNAPPENALESWAFCYKLGPFNLITYDCNEARYIRSNATFTEAMATKLSAYIAANNQKPVILAGHYPVVIAAGVHESWQHKVLGAKHLRNVLNECEIGLYMQGHKHVRWNLTSSETPYTTHVNSGSCGLRSTKARKQPGYVIIDVDDATGKVKNVTAVYLDLATESFKESCLPAENGLIVT